MEDQGPPSTTPLIIYEDERVYIRNPQGEEEIQENEDLIIDCRLENPVFTLSYFVREEVKYFTQLDREAELLHGERFSIFDKASGGELCGAFCVSKLSNRVHPKADMESMYKNRYLMRAFENYFHMLGEIKRLGARYFEDESQTCLMHCFSVRPKYRGRGLASLMDRVSREQTRRIGCRYVYAHMITPETIHIARKIGY
jgi:GNAT superfamily N-acetyltransferase